MDRGWLQIQPLSVPISEKIFKHAHQQSKGGGRIGEE